MSRLWVTPEELGEDGNSPFAYEACKTASFILWAYSGRKYGGSRTVTERYECACRSADRYRSSAMTVESGGLLVTPRLEGGQIYNDVSSCGCSGTVGGSHTRLRLRGRPVRAVQKVVSGSRELDTSEYQVVNSSVLQAAPGASLDVCGLEVTYTYGIDPPSAGRRAARYLAKEFSKAYSGEECELPDRVTSVSRQGVSYTILDNQAFIDDLRTGVYAVDLFLKAVNPDKARKPARVFSPDLPRPSRTTINAPVSAGPYDLSIIPNQGFTWSAPLLDINGELLVDTGNWRPQGQITTWNGALLLEFDSTRFSIANKVLTLTLTPEETGRINIGASGVWDLYATSTSDQYTVVHVMTSNVHLVVR